MKKEKVQLSKREQRLKWVLLSIILVIFLVIGLGIYYQGSEGNIEQKLSVALFALFGIFFILLGRNGLKNGKIIPKAMPFLFSSADNQSTEKHDNLVKNAGIVHIAMGIIMFILSFTNL